MSSNRGFRIKPLRKVAKGSTRDTVDTLHSETIERLTNNNLEKNIIENQIKSLSNKNEENPDNGEDMNLN